VCSIDTGKHPFHLHGHNFQAIARSAEDDGVFDPTNSTQTAYPAIPMRRDTFVLKPQGYIVLRFQADNPGVWLFHCHIEWHVDQGLIATMVEAPLELQKSLSIPQDHLAACQAGNIPTVGNAAANTLNYLDLTGQNAQPAPLPAGFTPRGIVALTFSCISALLGLGVITWYVAILLLEDYKLKIPGMVWRTWEPQTKRLKIAALLQQSKSLPAEDRRYQCHPWPKSKRAEADGELV